jgi:hypothetical protein
MRPSTSETLDDGTTHPAAASVRADLNVGLREVVQAQPVNRRTAVTKEIRILPE